MAKNYEIFSKERWYDMKYDGRKKMFRGISKKDWCDAKQKAFRRRFVRTTADDYVISELRKAYLRIKEWAKPERGSYQKIAMYGHTWLYLCSPVFGHDDYNKSRIYPIKGHERECEWLIKVSERVSNGSKA